MTIRKILLLAFSGVVLATTLPLAALSFINARLALEQEIERSLVAQADSASASVDHLMFERQQNALTWSSLDVLQDLQIHDIDHRLSQFLLGLRQGYGDIYMDLSGLDGSGLVVSSSDRQLIGKTLARKNTWLSLPGQGSVVQVEAPDLDRRALVMRVPITSRYNSQFVGTLRLCLAWAKVEDVLDQVDAEGGRVVVILDRQGHIIARSKTARTVQGLRADALLGWRDGPGAASVRDAGPLRSIFDSAVIVGKSTTLSSAHLGTGAGLGWTTLVIEPVDLAYAPVRRMARIYIALSLAMLACAGVLANWTSRAIARPILELTDFARAYMLDKSASLPPGRYSGELADLADAFVRMIRDIEQSQSSLVRASKFAVIGEMSAAIAHEVRTPLGILRSSAQMLRREKDVSASAQELLGFIESETARLNRLVSNLLDTARVRPTMVSRIDAHELILKVMALLRPMAQKQGAELNAILGAKMAWIDGDEEQLTQVLLNLVLNALQHLSEHGQVQIRTSNASEDLIVSVDDNGPGISAADRDRVFEAFFCRREGGIGLGLAIVQQIIAKHAGDIHLAQSALGGANFVIRLPSPGVRENHHDHS